MRAAIQNFTVEVDNLKCGGCANTIRNGLKTLRGVENVVVDPDADKVSFDSEADVKPAVLGKLKSMGYPEKGSTHGIEAGLATAKSYVSCAVGKLG